MGTTRTRNRVVTASSGLSDGRKLKQLHLVTDDGFLRSTMLWLLLYSILLGFAWSYAPLRLWAMDKYEEVKLTMLRVAHHMAWWSMLGLLSSACCVLQMILNLFSFGCAGFNTLLGPVRPPLIALTGIAQAVSWYVAYPLPFQWAPTAATTALSLLLTFSPELLHWRQQRASAHDAARCAPGVGPARSVVRIDFEPKSMGCISCVTKVRKTLEQHPSVLACSVSLPNASAVALLSLDPGASETSKVAVELVEKIVSRGFPAELQSLHSATPADIEEMAISSEDPAQSSPARQGRQSQGWQGGVEYVQCVLGGLLGSSCCLLQLGANALASLNVAHIGCTGFNKVLGPVRPQVRMVTGVYMGCYWLWTLSRRPSRRAIVRLAITSAVFVGLTFLPEVLLLTGGPALAPPTADVQVLRLQVDGMGCEACQTHVKNVLDRSGGVIASSVDFTTGHAEVMVAKGWGSFNLTAVARKLEDDGYMVQVLNMSDTSPLDVRDSSSSQLSDMKPSASAAMSSAAASATEL